MSVSASASNPELVDALERLRLGRIATSLPERLVLADNQDMAFDELLLLLLTDEIARRDNAASDNRASNAGLDPSMHLEHWDKTAKVSFDERVLAELAGLRFLETIVMSAFSVRSASARHSSPVLSAISRVVTATMCLLHGPTTRFDVFVRVASTTRATRR